MQERLPFDQPLTIFAALPDDTMGEALECRGKDISLNGLGVLSSQQPLTSQVYVQLEGSPPSASTLALARVMRVQPVAEGGYEIGLLFLSPLDQAAFSALIKRPGDDRSEVG